MKFDLTDFNDSGFVVVPPGSYEVETRGWQMWVKEETGNTVIAIDTEIVKGEYAGSNVRRIITIKEGDKDSVGRYMRTLSQLGIIKDGDRELHPDKKLLVDAVYGDEDGYGRTNITAIDVNGEKRKVEGIKATAIVTSYESGGETRSSIDRFEPAGKASASGASGKKDLPF